MTSKSRFELVSRRGVDHVHIVDKMRFYVDTVQGNCTKLYIVV